MNRSSSLLILAIFSIFIFSCSRRNVGFRLVEKSDFQVDRLDFEYLSGKMKVNFHNGEKELGATVNLRMKADSIIWMSVTPGLGVEVARAQFTPESITILNKLKKEVYYLDYQQLSEQYKVALDFFVLQSILVGDLIEQQADKDRVKRESNVFLLDQERAEMQYLSRVDPLSYRIQRTQAIQAKTGNTLTLEYSDFQEIKNKNKKKTTKENYKQEKKENKKAAKMNRKERKSDIFPFKNEIDVVFHPLSGGTLSTHVKVEFQKVDINEKKLSFPFKVTSRYVPK